MKVSTATLLLEEEIMEAVTHGVESLGVDVEENLNKELQYQRMSISLSEARTVVKTYIFYFLYSILKI